MPLLVARSDSRLQEDALDGMRGLAALLVVVSHFSNAGVHPIPGLDLGGIGKPGVYLFFVLSAFLLTRQILVRTPAELAERSLWVHYFTRRFLRIFPLFIFILVTSYGVGRWFGLGLPYPISGRELVGHLLLLRGKSVLWSIPPEFQYYFVLPLFGAACVLWRKWIALVVVASVLLGAAALWIWPLPLPLADANRPHLGPYLPLFLLGSLAALAHDRLTRHAARWRPWLEGVAWASLAGALLTIPSLYRALTGEPISSEHFHNRVILYGLLWSAFLLGTLLGTGACRAALSGRVIRYVGFISFGIYLWHTPVLRVVKVLSPLPDLANAWLGLVAIASISSASYFAIERPCLGLSARRSARPRG